MEERRKFERIRASYYLRTYDNKTGDYIGQVSDISQQGMRILCDKPFIPGTAFQIKTLLPEDSMLGESIIVLAVNRWCTKNKENNVYECGFEFKEDAGVGFLSIKTLISDLTEERIFGDNVQKE